MPGYGDDDGLAAWLAGQGLTLPAGAVPAVVRQLGSDYVDAAYAHRLTCSSPTGGFEQERAWPRIGAVMGGRAVPDDLVPPAWINASYRAALLIARTPAWATGIDPNRAVKRQKAGTVEREFFAASETAVRGNAGPGFPVDPMIDGMVSGWLCGASGRGLGFMVV